MPAKSNVHAFFGTDEAQVKEAALRLARELAPEDDEFGLEVVRGGADNSDHAARIVADTIEAIQTLPFFGGDKVVWLQDANFFGDNQTGRAESTLGAVESLIELLEAGLPDGVALVISASEVDKRRSFYKRLGKLTKIQIYDKVDVSRAGWETKVMGRVSDRARELGMIFQGAAMERFVLLVGADSRALDSELEKLSLYVGDRPVTEDDVHLVVSRSHVGVIFEIGDAISGRNLPRAQELIARQLQRGESAIGILLAAIVPKVRNLLHLRDLAERHGIRPGRNYKAFQGKLDSLPPEETAHFPRNKDGGISAYPLFMMGNAVDRFSVAELKAALEACLEANERLVTSQLEPHLVLDQLVTRILSRAG